MISKRMFFLLALTISPVLRGDFLPPNHLHLEKSGMLSKVSEADYREVIREVYDYFDPIVYRLGGDLKIRPAWSSDLVNATARQDGDDWIITIYGGLARRPELTLDGLTMVLCHELGHHIAGFPMSSFWAANEGNSDYFAAQACTKALWKGRKWDESEGGVIPPEGKRLCDENFERPIEDLNLCYRQMGAIDSISKLLAYLDGTEIQWGHNDPRVVERTFHNHPPAQCRLDTFIQGALCKRENSFTRIPWNEREMSQYSCHQVWQDQLGIRPRCWFRSRLSAE